MVRIITPFILLVCTLVSVATAETYPGVLFENSLLSGNYSYSEVRHSGSSWVENVSGRLPVSDTLFFTPGNSLSLKYISAPHGDWSVRIAYPHSKAGYRPSESDVLTFKVFIASASASNVMPKIAIYQGGNLTDAIEIAKYIDNFQANIWLDVRIPVGVIGGLSREEAIEGINLSQSATGDATHLLYIDQVEFLPANPPSVKLSSPAVLASATAFDRHVDLTWQLPLTPSIRYIKIYRSADNEHFDPVAIRPVFVQKCTDFVPYPNKTYYYKIAWIDYDYLESPFSNVLEATPEAANDSMFLDFVQAAHFNYFAERVEVNSGMHAVYFGVDDATVSVRETGLSILAHVVGAERGFISRAAVISRLDRIVNFLGKVTRYHGAFPAYIDGRTGIAVTTVEGLPEADLQANASLMQGLLVAQQYLQADSEDAGGLCEKITLLWNEIEWNQFVVSGQEAILLDRWSPVSGFKHALPLGGFGADLNTYILALASPQHALEPRAYTEGLGIARKLSDSTHVMELANNDSFSVNIGDSLAIVPGYVEFPYTNHTILYGLPISVGSVDTSLLVAYTPFFALDPRGKRDTFADYFANNINLTEVYKRRDNAYGYGGPSQSIWGMTTHYSDSLDTPVRVISPAIASASYAYQPNEALQSMRAFYDTYGGTLFSEYGFRSWLAPNLNAMAADYDALNQAATIVMIENGRSGLLWNLFSNHPDIKKVVETHFSIE